MRHTYFILDTAIVGEGILSLRDFKCIYEPFYKVTGIDDLIDVVPYLVNSQNCNDAILWLTNVGWGKAWGILLITKCTFREAFEHFSKFIIVQTEDGQELYFRFYDPRVLKIFLPTCDEKQIIEFFGPVDKFIVEGETKDDAIEFSHQNGMLKQKIISATEVFGNMETINA